MSRLSMRLAAMLALALPAGGALAQNNSEAKPVADARVASLLKALNYQYEIDEDGDYKLVFDVDKEGGRPQLVYVRSAVESYGDLKVREIWSPGYVGTTEQFPQAVANRLLEATMESKLGGWGKQDKSAVFIIRIPADAAKQMLDTAITAAIHSADEMENALTPGKDEL